MDIQVSSNFECFLFEAAGRDAPYVRGKMGGLKQSCSIGLGDVIVPYRGISSPSPTGTSPTASGA